MKPTRSLVCLFVALTFPLFRAASPGQEAKDSPTRLAGPKDSPKVKALIEGYDRRKPVESKVAILQRILAIPPADLAEIAKAMSEWRRSDPPWSLAKSAVIERWLEVAPQEALTWVISLRKGEPESHEVAALFGMLANLDHTRAMAEALRIPHLFLKISAIESVMRSVWETDPEEAFRMCQTLPGGGQAFYSKLFAAWAERDPAGAAAGWRTLKDQEQRRVLVPRLMHPWARRDPVAALAWAKGITEPDVRKLALASYFSMLGYHDPERAISQISEFPRHQQHDFLTTVLGGWMRTNPDAAIAWVLARPHSIERQRLIPATLGSDDWNFQQASKMVVRLVPGPRREQSLRGLIDRWVPSDADAAIAFSRTLTAGEERSLREQIAGRLADLDPEKAMAYLKDHPIDNPGSDVPARIARALAHKGSASKALEWAKGLPDEYSRRGELPAVFSWLARENPVEAAKEAAALPDEAVRLECLTIVASVWAEAAMSEALAWAKGLAGEDRETAVGAVLLEGIPREPVMAAAELAVLVAGVSAESELPNHLVSAAERIATVYFAENEQAAAKWAASLPPDEAGLAAVRSLVDQWVQYDPTGANEWIRTLPGGKPRATAIREFVVKVASSDPATAFALVSSFPFTIDHLSHLDRIIYHWRTFDAAAARTAIQDMKWPEQVKTKWLDQLKPVP